MTTFAVVEKASGQEVYRYTAEAPVAWLRFPFATHTHTEVPPAPPEPEAPHAPARITKLAFRQRFTQAEKAAIEIAASDNPNAPIQQRAMSAALRAQLAGQRDALHIDLARADTIAGVRALETAGLLAAGRADAILTAPITEHEAYLG